MREPATLSRRAAAGLPLAALFGSAAATSATAARATSPDPVLERIERHRALGSALARMSGQDDDPAYVTACDDEEAALQMLADALPTTIAGAAALLTYMAEVVADPGALPPGLVRPALAADRSRDGFARGRRRRVCAAVPGDA